MTDADKKLRLFITDIKGFIRSAPGACVIKLITAVIYNFRNKLVFVPGKPFQPSLVFSDKHSKLITETVNYGRNKFYDTGPRSAFFQI